MTTASQAAKQLDLEWNQGDPVSIPVTVVGVAHTWDGAYVVESDTASVALMTAAVVGGVTDAVLTFTLTVGNSANVPKGTYDYRLQQTGGPTRCIGTISVI